MSRHDTVVICKYRANLSRHRAIQKLQVNDLKQIKENMEYLIKINRFSKGLHLMNISTLLNKDAFNGLHAKFSKATLKQDIDILSYWIFGIDAKEVSDEDVKKLKSDDGRMHNIKLLLGSQLEVGLGEAIWQRRQRTPEYGRKMRDD